MADRTKIAMERHVTVTVPGRLHFGFLDLNGGLGRRFGSFGMTLEEVHTRLVLSSQDTLTSCGPSSRRIEKLARIFLKKMNLPGFAEAGLAIEATAAIPEHMGLGSGTQMALAVGAGMAALYGLDLSATEIARMANRGARSGIGIAAFEKGGVILDGGNPVGQSQPEGGSVPPPVTARFDFPENWRVLLIFDNNSIGLHGQEETGAFRDLPPYTEELSGRLCRLILMKALPALAEKNLQSFGESVTALQKTVGDHFASAQGGRYASPAVARVLDELDTMGVAGYGQSSWGPTGFAFFESESEALKTLDKLKEKHPVERKGDEGLSFVLCRGRNQGSLIEIHDMSRLGRDVKTHA